MLGKSNADNPEAEMGFFDHLESLRWHLIRSVIAVVVCASLVGIFYEFVFETIILASHPKISRPTDWCALLASI
jgi:Sec-independent protein secretion pathway component TatC